MSNDELAVIEGKRELLVGKLQHQFGLSRREAWRQLATFVRSERHRRGR